MFTLDAMVDNGESITLKPNLVFIPIADIEDDQEKNCSGYITYKAKGGDKYQRQRFYLLVGDSLISYLTCREVDTIIILGDVLERRFKEQGMMVVEVSLPKSHGYSGRTFGYYSTKRMFGS